MSRVNAKTILPSVNCQTGALSSPCIDMFTYALDISANYYLTIKGDIDGHYCYLNGRFRQLTQQLSEKVLNKTERDIFEGGDQLHHPWIQSIRRTDIAVMQSQYQICIEGQAIDAKGDYHIFYTWKAPILFEQHTNRYRGIITSALVILP